eukprot:389641_1
MYSNMDSLQNPAGTGSINYAQPQTSRSRARLGLITNSSTFQYIQNIVLIYQITSLVMIHIFNTAQFYSFMTSESAGDSWKNYQCFVEILLYSSNLKRAVTTAIIFGLGLGEKDSDWENQVLDAFNWDIEKLKQTNKFRYILKWIFAIVSFFTYAVHVPLMWTHLIPGFFVYIWISLAIFGSAILIGVIVTEKVVSPIISATAIWMILTMSGMMVFFINARAMSKYYQNHSYMDSLELLFTESKWTTYWTHFTTSFSNYFTLFTTVF